MGGWFRDPIESVDDLQGLKFRMPGLGGEALRQLGVNVIALPGGEIFQALQSGAIDGTEWVGPWNDLAFGFYRIAKNYYYPGFHEPGALLSVGVNRAALEELSATDQAIIENACHAENGYMYAEYIAKNGQALDTLVQQHDVQLRKFPEAVFDRFAEASEAVVSDVADYDDIGRRIVESYRNARREFGEWTRISEQSYSDERSRSLRM
jgi:TRAP-type mannitol/chloroaromatic compound transport system substrate-binding protein